MGMVLYLRRAQLAVLEAIGEDELEVLGFIFSETSEVDELIDFDKAWDALNFMLIDGQLDSASPLNFLLGEWAPLGHNPVFDEPYGKIVPPDAVAQFNVALQLLTDEALASRYNPQSMLEAEVYLADSFVEEGDQALEYIMQSVPALRRFAQVASERQQAVAIVVQ